jgi:hypothetical protein
MYVDERRNRKRSVPYTEPKGESIPQGCCRRVLARVVARIKEALVNESEPLIRKQATQYQHPCSGTHDHYCNLPPPPSLHGALNTYLEIVYFYSTMTDTACHLLGWAKPGVKSVRSARAILRANPPDSLKSHEWRDLLCTEQMRLQNMGTRKRSYRLASKTHGEG